MIYRMVEIKREAPVEDNEFYIVTYALDDVEREYDPKKDNKPNNTLFWCFPSEIYTDDEAIEIMKEYFIEQKQRDIEWNKKLIEKIKNIKNIKNIKTIKECCTN